jgi:hypothetical protein
MTTEAQRQAMIDAVMAVDIDWHDGAISGAMVDSYPILVGEGEEARVDEVAAQRAAHEIAERYPFLVKPQETIEERIAKILGPDLPPAVGLAPFRKFYGVRPLTSDAALRLKYPALNA